MSKTHKSEKVFDEIMAAMRTAIFTREKATLLPEIYAIKLTDVAHHQKPLLRLFQNLRFYEKADYRGFIAQQEIILETFSKSAIYQYFKIAGNFFVGLANNILGNYTTAVAQMQACHIAATKLEEDQMIAEIETALGHIFSEFGYLKIAQRYYESSLFYAEKQNIESLKIINGFGLLKLYFDQANEEQMVSLLEQMKVTTLGLSLPIQLNLLRWEMEYLQLSNQWKLMAQKRVEFTNACGDFFNPYFFIAIYLLDAKLAAHQGSMKEAILYFENALKSARDIGSMSAESIVYRDLAKFLKHQKEYKKAAKYLQQSMDLAKKMESNKAFAFTYELLHQLALQQGDLEVAFSYFKEYHTYTERLNEYDEKTNSQLLKSVAMLKEKTTTIKLLQAELNAKSDELQMTQFVLQQKKQVIDEVTEFMFSLRKENLAKNKLMLRLEQRLKEANVFEQNNDQLVSSYQADILQWTTNFALQYPSLSKAELRICFYTAKGYANKEIASILFATSKNIEQTKYRIKKRLAFDSKLTLEEFLKRGL